jgi:hypothetical protein
MKTIDDTASRLDGFLATEDCTQPTHQIHPHPRGDAP